MAEALPPPLEEIRRQLEAARDRAHAVAAAAGETFAVQPAPGRWSVGQCLEHLNESTKRFLPAIDEALGRPNPRAAPSRWRPRRDLAGWLLSAVLEPPARFKVKTSEPFEPHEVGSAADVLKAFDQWQDQLNERLAHCAGLDIAKIKMTSPFDGRIKYSVYSAFRITAAHQRRHLWQAEQVVRVVGGM